MNYFHHSEDDLLMKAGVSNGLKKKLTKEIEKNLTRQKKKKTKIIAYFTPWITTLNEWETKKNSRAKCKDNQEKCE